LPYGGADLAGRFEWSMLVPLLAWTPMVVRAVESSSRRLCGLAGVIAGLWILEWIPILRGQHVYYNQVIRTPPWDLSAYPGWWDRLDVLLPVFVPSGRLLGWPWNGLPSVVVILALAGLVAYYGTRWHSPRFKSLLGLSTVAVVAVVVAGLALPVPVPSSSLTFSGADVGSPLIAGPQPVTTAAVPLQAVGSGTFKVEVVYTLDGGAPNGRMTAYCGGDSAGAPVVSGSHSQQVSLACPAGTISFNMQVGPATTLTVSQVHLTKTASS
jgi:hypothetical protein